MSARREIFHSLHGRPVDYWCRRVGHCFCENAGQKCCDCGASRADGMAKGDTAGVDWPAEWGKMVESK